jgi:RNA polymerase sigma-70 factor (ECF subfamily)
MNTTSVTLLDRLKDPGPDEPAWDKFQGIYRPLIHSYLSRVPGLGDEVDDLTQEVFLVLRRELPSFERQQAGAFRSWLRQIVVNRIRAFWKTRRKQPAADPAGDIERHLSQLEDPDSDLAKQWDREHDRHLLHKLLAAAQPDFEASTWQAFVRFALDEIPAALVAKELRMSESAVVQAKFRVLKRLRQEAGGFLD